jgi:flagellar basal body-associated protein FliL
VRNRILYIVGAVVALATVFGVSFLTLKFFGPEPGPAAGAVGVPVAQVEITAENTVELTEFVTNLAEERRYIKVTMELVLSNDKLKPSVESNVPRIRDAVVQVLNAKQSVEVTGSEGANKLKVDIKEAVNKLLGGTPVHEVLITDIVVQF